MAAIDPARCPLCGASNDCALAQPESAGTACWCAAVQIAPEVRRAIPAAARNRACVCRTCATSPSASTMPTDSTAPPR
ncbi:MAG: cysteine-rich CWC family protein [Planctomycetota bacterium]